MNKVISKEYVHEKMVKIRLCLEYGQQEKAISKILRLEKACEPRVYSESQVYGMDCRNGQCDQSAPTSLGCSVESKQGQNQGGASSGQND